MGARRLDVDAVVAAGVAGLDPARHALFADYTRAILAGVERLHGAGTRAVAELAGESFAWLCEPAAEEIRVRVRPAPGRPGQTRIEIAQDDRPFIVDSVRMVLRRHGLRERLFLHPVIGIHQAGDGALEAVGAGPGARRRSLVFAEVAPGIEDPERAAALEEDLRGVLACVRDVTSDHRRMIRVVRELGANVEFTARHLEGGSVRAERICRFLDWLIDGRFVFVGLRRYGLRTPEDGGSDADLEAWLQADSGLGLWRGETASLLGEPRRGDGIPEEIREFARDPLIIWIDKSRLESRIHREGRLDRVVVKEHDEDGRLVGIAIVHGLFTFRALRTPASQVPLLAERLEQVLARDGAPADSHRHKATVAAFDSAPVEFLLSRGVDDIAALIHELVAAEGSKEAHLVLRLHRNHRSFYAAVVLPRERYGEELRSRIREFFAEHTGATYLDDRTSFIEEGAAVIHFFCTAQRRFEDLPDPRALEAEIRALCARWEERLGDALLAARGEREAAVLAARYETAFSEALRARTHPQDAVRDVEAFEALHATGRIQFSLHLDRGRNEPATLLKIYLPEPRLLSELLHRVDHFGIQVVDARQDRVTPSDRPPAVVETLRVLPLGASQADLDLVAPRLAEALGAVLEGVVADDALNALVLGAGLDWRQVDLVRAYLEYFVQIQGTLARAFVRRVLLDNPLAVRLLVRLHEARFDPRLAPADREAREALLEQAFQAYRDRIVSLNEDRALSGLHGLVRATLRSDVFVTGREPHRITLKLDPAAAPELRGPRPHREIFVHSARLTGIHLRGGPVARGGLRWSDRADDLRVEVLGLMRTQMLKNGLIVPVGAKGGFVVRQDGLSPREARALADEQYRVFVDSLLAITDDVEPDGRVIAPEGVHRRDGDDPYLVVAADKGTAHLSDAANEVSAGRRFWLGDAFASGGSEGYDHKKYGITARGAWECVKHRFAELDLDAERDVFTAAGIGDMSGDVFGNGMLLARRVRLVAAFDHRHVFLDPDPDPETSWRERRRLFELPGSTWEDYDPALLSEGGGVFPRSAKRIELSPAARRRLGLEATHASGNEVVRAILAMEVDLLWNGGIGTYVMGSRETHAEVGDRANDVVRITARELRARVVGEGGNLGLTQAARVEAALAGVKLDTDAIDNSAGVDLSDHEVNYKVLFAPLVRSGEVSPDARRAALLGAAETACESVLAHNRSQALAISLDERRSREDLEPFARAVDALCAPEEVDRAELGLPDAATLKRRAAAGRGLTRPELAVLLGLAKLQARQALAASPLVESAYWTPRFEGYFPEAFRTAHPEAVRGHRLRPEITALVVTSRLVDAGGVTLVSALGAELGIAPSEVLAAVQVAEDVLEAERYRSALLSPDAAIPREPLYAALCELDRGVRGVARFLVRSGAARLDASRVASWHEGLRELDDTLMGALGREEAEAAERRGAALAAQGVPDALAAEVAALPLADRGLNVLRIAETTGLPPATAARVYARVGEGTGIQWAHRHLASAELRDPWDRLTQIDLGWELLDLQRALTEAVLADKPDDPGEAVDAFVDANTALLDRIRALQRRAGATPNASALAVVAGRLRELRAVF